MKFVLSFAANVRFALLLLSLSLSGVSYGQTTLQAAWYFDEAQWSGVAGEVIDSSGNGFDGRATKPIVNSSEGVVCGAADFSENSTTDGVILDADVLDRENNFSISVWGKLPTSATQSQTILSGAYRDNRRAWDNSVLLFFSNPRRVNLFYAQRNFLSANIAPINDDQWHHFVWTRSGNNNCFYLDGVRQTCSRSDGGAPRISDGGLYIAQEQDSLGGRFTSSQDWDGLLDELLIFRSTLNDGEVQSIYTNQLNQLNWDGSTRACAGGPPSGDLPEPIGDWHLDESQWAGVADEITDYSGNSYHGQASKAMPTVEEGAVCRAADFTPTALDDFISLDYQAFQGLTEMSFSVWGKTSQRNQTQALFSGFGPQFNNELLLFFWNSQRFEPLIKRNSFSQQNLITTPDIADNQWHHFVYTRNGSKNCLYIDGVLQGCRYGLDAGALNFSPGGVILGQEQDTLQGGFDSGQDWDGYIDEPLLFNKELGASQVREIYNNQLAKKNYDGSERRCEIPVPVFDYRFDSCNWSDGRDVVDSGPNGLDAYAENGVLSTIDGKVCGLARFDSLDDYIRLPSNSLVSPTERLSLTSWIRLERLPSSLSSIVSKDTNYEYHITSNGSVYWWWNDSTGAVRTLTSSARVNLNQWHHIAITYMDGKQVIYLDGNAVATSTFEGELITNSNPLQIGQDHGLSDRFFPGDIDEVKLFDVDLLPQEVEQIYTNELAERNYDGTARSCNCTAPVTIDHYSISHSGSLVSCLTEQVTITARNDQSGAEDAEDRTITISTSSGKGSWDGIVQGSGVLTALSGGRAAYRFPNNGESSVTLSFRYPDLVGSSEIINFDVTDGVVTDRRDGGSEDRDLVVSDVGLLFDVPDMQSCEVTPNFTVSIVRATDNQRVCEAAVVGQRNLSVTSSYISPASGGRSVLLNSQGSSYAISAVPQTVPAIFNSSGEATFSASYADAGEVQLDISVVLGGKTISGSDTFIAYPTKLAISAMDSSNTSLLGASATHVASAPFTLSVTAQCSNGMVTPNYEPSNADLGVYMQTPTKAEGATGGAWVVGSSVTVSDDKQWRNISSLFSGGVMMRSDVTYSEVGALFVLARDTDYMGYSIAESEESVGRFIPSYFSLAQNAALSGPRWEGHCSADQFAYQNREIGFSVHPELTVTAHGANGQVVNNYSGADWKLAEDAVGRTYSNQTSSLASLVPSLGTPSWNGTNQSFNGQGVLSLADDTVTYVKNGLEAPFDMLVGLEFDEADLTDTDGVCYRVDTDGDSVVDSSCLSYEWVDHIAGPEVRYGRLYLANAYGPETAALPLSWLTQYYDGSAFVTNTLDSCSQWLNSEVSLRDVAGGLVGGGLTSISFVHAASDFKVIDGDAGASLTAPGAGQVGTVAIDVDLSGAAYLQFDWDGDGADDTEVSAEAIFGRYRSHDRVIYQKQF
ncbi:LamG domain-containing protein [Neptunomonas sp. XY-337]|uniref:LamG domain-containing protein n=1 Tax=Neptunomonas sp. XY-337 TaxID=2561897 RepID=UPI0010AA6EC0|nr:LamG domain-containing protein [Neptunomonas sp. XY-337]